MSWGDIDPDKAWLGVYAMVAVFGAKRLLDALFPRGARFKFMTRYLDYTDELAVRRRDELRRKREERDEDSA